jgi:hypothetical protein
MTMYKLIEYKTKDGVIYGYGTALHAQKFYRLLKMDGECSAKVIEDENSIDESQKFSLCDLLENLAESREQQF